MKKSLALILALIMVLCMLPSVAFAENMSWTWTVTIIGDNYYMLDGTESSTNKYTITKYLDNSTDHEIGYKFEWKASAGGSNYDGGWQLCLTVDGNIVVYSTAYIYDRNMSTASATWTAPASSHTGNSSHTFILNLSDYQNRFQNITLSYNANEGTGAPESETKKVKSGEAATFRVSSTEPTRTNYDFKGWSTDRNAKAADYHGGESITISQDTTLYAVWEENNEPQPETPPAQPDPRPSATPTIDGLTGVQVVEVKCITENSGHAKQAYQLIEGSYAVGEVQGDKESGYTCDITVNPGEYVKAYNTDINNVTHTLAPAGQTGTIKLSWNGTDKKWELANPSGVPVVFTVKCDTTVPGSVSAVTKTRLTDVANVPLPRGVDINVEPVVTFTDNNTSATLLYEFKVTGTPGAEVVIKDDGATFIKNTTPISTVPQQITVTLPAAEGNETETSTTVYGYRTFSVDDIQNGKLVNNATANVEGDDNNKKEAKAEVDATDERTLKNTLTVKKLVSGNAANMTEKFPFKATFTFPVPVASPTQDGVTYGETVEINFELAHDQTRTFSYTSDAELKTKIDKWMEEYKAYGLYTGDNVFAMLRYKVEETDTKGYTLATSGNAEGNAAGHNTVTFTNTKNKPNDDHGGHYHPTTTPVPVIVIPPKTGDMPFWYSIAQFLGLVK